MNVLVVSTIYNLGADNAIGGEDANADTVAYRAGSIWECTDDTFTKRAGVDNLSKDNFSASTYAVIEVYVFFNGDDADCTQEKLAAAQSANYTVEIQFTVA